MNDSAHALDYSFEQDAAADLMACSKEQQSRAGVQSQLQAGMISVQPLPTDRQIRHDIRGFALGYHAGDASGSQVLLNKDLWNVKGGSQQHGSLSDSLDPPLNQILDVKHSRLTFGFGTCKRRARAMESRG